jgi:hypothetical protein
LQRWPGSHSPASVYDKILSNESIKDVDARTQGGSIFFFFLSTTDARIEVYITSNNGRENSLSKEEIQKRLSEDYEFSITASGGKLTAISKVKHNDMNWKRALSISYKIFVPQNVSTDLSTSGGSISLLNLSGTQDFRTSGGSLTVDKVSEKSMAELPAEASKCPIQR